MAERIRLAVSHEPFRFGNVDLTVTVSQGVTTWTEPCPIPIERLIQTADGALYLVKNSGRNGVEFARFDVHSEHTFSPLTTLPTTGKQ
jgi:PleD family two-component response regulator